MNPNDQNLRRYRRATVELQLVRFDDIIITISSHCGEDDLFEEKLT